jgi:hypothetical protein
MTTSTALYQGREENGLGHHLLDGHLLPLLGRELWKVAMAYLLENRGSGLLVLRGKGV